MRLGLERFLAGVTKSDFPYGPLTLLTRIVHRESFIGSGVLVAADRVLTCAHVLTNKDGGRIQKVSVQVGSEKAMAGTVEARSPVDDPDLALIKLDAPVEGVEPPHWVNAAPGFAAATLVGYRGQRLEGLDVADGVPKGMSGYDRRSHRQTRGR